MWNLYLRIFKMTNFTTFQNLMKLTIMCIYRTETVKMFQITVKIYTFHLEVSCRKIDSGKIVMYFRFLCNTYAQTKTD